jgi:hypothetical protein
MSLQGAKIHKNVIITNLTAVKTSNIDLQFVPVIELTMKKTGKF